jgi:hypothetical protein
LSEKPDEAVKEIKELLDKSPDLVKFGELTKHNDNHQTDDSSVQLTEGQKEDRKKILVYLDSHKMEYSINEIGLIVTKNPNDLGVATAAVRNQG